MEKAPRKNTYADVMKMPVEYAGRNPVGQHMFKNGTPLVSDVCNTLEEAVERFGSRIQTHEKEYRLGADYRLGYGAAKYEPRKGARPQEVTEYGFGYLRKLLDAPKPAVAPVQIAAPPHSPTSSTSPPTSPRSRNPSCRR